MRLYPLLRAFVLSALVAMPPAEALADNGLGSWRTQAEQVRGLAENDVPTAYKQALQLQSSLPASASATDRVRVLNLLARIEVYMGDAGVAERHAKEAFNLALQSNDRAGQAEADLNNVLIAVNQGGFDAMTVSIKHSMTILDGVDRPDLLIEAMLRISTMYCRFDHFGACLNEATRTMDIAERGGIPLGLAQAYKGMAGAYDYLGRHAKARDYYQKMRHAARVANSRLQEGDAQIGLGSAIAEMGDAEGGERLIRAGIQLYRKAGGPFHVAQGQYSLAGNLRKQGRLVEAQAALNETVAIYERKPNKVGLWRALCLRSENSRELGRNVEAIADIDRAYKLAMAIGQPLYLSESVRMMVANAAEAGDYQHAYRLSVQAEESAKEAREQVFAHRLELAKDDEYRNQQRQLEELILSKEIQALQERWQGTVLAGCIVLLAVSGLFLLNLRRSREAVRKLNIGLEQRVRERTAELHQSQQSLAVRARELRALADSSPGVMACFHIEANGWISIPYVSPNIIEQYGLHPQDVAEDAAPLGRLCHPEDAKRLHESIAESARTMTPWHQEYRILHPTKGERWMEGHTNPQPHPDGGTIWHGYLFDITERKRMEAALAAREREFRSLAENLQVNIARWDLQGRFLYINPAYERTLGVLARDIIGKEISDTHKHVKSAIAEVAATGQAIALVRQSVVVDGETRIHEVSLAPERDADGRIVNVLGIGRDMTDFYRMQEAIAAREQEFRGLAESLPENIIRFDRDARVLYINSRLLSQLGLESAEEVIGKRPGEVWPDGRFTHVEQAAECAVESGSQVNIEIVKPGGSGAQSYYQTFVVPERDVTGQVIGAIAFSRDISDIRVAERRLNSLVENLPGFAFSMCDASQGGWSLSFASSGIEDICGFKPEDVKADIMLLQQMAHPDDWPQVKAALAECRRTLQPFHVEFRVQRPDHSERWVECRSKPDIQSNCDIIWHGIMLDITERKKVQQRMELMEQAIDLSSDAIYLVDQELRFAYVNISACRALGYSRKELLAMGPLDIDPDVDRESLLQLIQTADSISFETRHRTRDGFVFPVELHASRFRRNGALFVLTAVRDITERKRMEAALKGSEERYRQNYSQLQSMMESASDVVIYALDLDCRFISFNNKNREMFKRVWGVDIAVGMCILDAIGDEEFREVCRQGYEKVLAGNSISLETHEKVEKNGRLVHGYWENFGSPIRNDAGEIVGLTVFATNITKRKEAEWKLREALEFTEGIISAIPDMLSEMDRDGRCLNVWTRKPELLVAQTDVMLGKTVNDLLAPENAATIMEALREAEERELSFGKTIRLDLPQGEKWFELSVSRKHSKSSSAATFLMLSRDITERKQAESRIRELNAELEQRVRERTIQLEAMNRELSESEQRYREIFENVTDALYLIEVTPEKQFRSLAFNRAFEKSTGFLRNELIGKIADQIQQEGNAMEREVARVMVARYRNCVEAGKPVESDSVLDLPIGRRYYQSTLVPLRDEAGEIRRILCVAHDVTHIKRVEREFRTLAENIPDNIIRYDRNARQVYANTTTEQTLGVSAEVLNNLTPEEMPESMRVMIMDEYARRVRQVLETGEAQEFEATLRHAEKGMQVHNIRFAAERDEQGTIVGALAVGHDITALKAIENELKESREQLRGLTAQRERAREEERKYIAREVHDELGQILTGLKLNISVLNHKLDAGQGLATGKLQETMLLTDRALEVARNVASALRPSVLEMGIVSALEWLAGRFETNTGILCELYIDDDDIQMDEAHAIALFRIVQESLTNVSRHAKAERVDIILRREAGSYVMKVKDNGAGFNARLKKTDSFGLVGIRERALMLGGTVDIDSQPGKGTEIVVRIPVQTTAEES